MRRLLVGVCLVAAAGCGPKKPSAQEIERIQMARAAREQVLLGCYDCLLRARTAYTTLAQGSARPAYVPSLFEIELLLTLREKELTMDWSASFKRAQALAAELPADVDAARYLAMVAAVPANAMGLAQTETTAFRREQQAFVPRINGEIGWLQTGPLQPAVREYLSLSLDCENPQRSRTGLAPLPGIRDPDPPGTPPLIRYRKATCDHLNAVALEALAGEVPGFVETAVFRGQLEVNLVQQTGGTAARALLNQAYARFPTSASATYLNGNFQQAVGDCAQALRFYDETLAMHPVHELALLGRTVCLTFLGRQDEAIATATRMIELRTFNMSEAYFWRAWVYHDRQQLPPAREDIEHAKRMSTTNMILRLAGIIEYDQDDLGIAETDLIAAKRAAGGDCMARWYLALIGVKRQKWAESAGHFEDAMYCYDAAALLTEAALQKMEANTQIDPEFKARQIAGFQATIKVDRSQYYASAFNAANHFARGGDVPKARPLLEIAAKDPALEKVVAELRKVIGGG